MAVLIIAVVLVVLISGYIYKLIKSAPLKYTDEERFIDAIEYEERLSHLIENDLMKFPKQANGTYL